MTDNSKEYLIYLEDVYQKYPEKSGRLKTVLNDIDFRARGGEFITVIGPTGCGKSTLLRLILGSEKPYSGKALINGVAVSSPNPCCGIVYQKYSLFPHLTVLENVIFGPELEKFCLLEKYYKPFLYRKKRKEFKEEALEYLKRVGLADDANKYPYQLSGGMRQRVAIVQALIMKPKILLMDEPFGALDDSTRQVMQLFILEQWEKMKMTIFFVTHDLEEALFLGTRIIALSQYYQTDCPDCEGSKIVIDKAISGGHPKPTHFKYAKEFNNLLEEVRRDGLDPNHRQHISQFDLSHKDAFRTVSVDEWKR
ncbi:MAG: ABC transporter ATP-binding protein [bacterium]